MNLTILSGYLGQDPTIRYGKNNKTVASFSLGVKRSFKRDNEPDTDWFDCVAFQQKAEFIDKYIRKGSKVTVIGETHKDEYEKDGIKHKSVQVIVNQIEFAESKKASEENRQASERETTDNGFNQVQETIDENNLPFV